MGGDDLLDRDEPFAVGELDEPREQRRDLHAREPPFPARRVPDEGREVQRERRDVRERVRRVDRQRREHREDALSERASRGARRSSVVELRPIDEPEPSFSSAGRSSADQSASARALSSPRGSLMPASCSSGVEPSGVAGPTPASRCSCRPATRTWKNSSRFDPKIARNLTPLEEPLRGSSARASTRSLKSSHESSRFRYRRCGGRHPASGAPMLAARIGPIRQSPRGDLRSLRPGRASGERSSADELVAETPHRHEVRRLVGILLDLLPEPLHVHVEGLGVAEVVLRPRPPRSGTRA